VGAVDVGLGEIQLASSFQILGEAVQQTLEDALLHPAFEAPIAG
jgi:hypothetical protein